MPMKEASDSKLTFSSFDTLQYKAQHSEHFQKINIVLWKSLSTWSSFEPPGLLIKKNLRRIFFSGLLSI